ncbi:unnamed protein product [Cyclocybe aegerita]|uniref:Uncharacterized protein n=1 Tax=Cyclocybe aegerita TaxID=1973307 RepID=A0A8S0VXK7_CYCAE|nr:unnamed protein product [Cyclocybe aegerita]
MRASFVAWSSQALLLLTVITSLISPALATPLPSSASSTVHIFVLPASEPSRPKAIIRPEGDTRRFTLVALSDLPEVQSHNSNIWHSLRALVAIFSPSYSSWPLGSSPSASAFSSARQLIGGPDATVNTHSMPPNLQFDRIHIQNRYETAHLLDVALERQIAALEIAREADGEHPELEPTDDVTEPPLPRRSKRVKLEAECEPDIEELEVGLHVTKQWTAASVSSKSKRERSKTSTRIPQASQKPHPEPPNWRATYAAIKKLRARIEAPVDTMG